MTSESKLGVAYRSLYELLCGKPTRPKPWHFQWMSSYYLSRRLRQVLRECSGRVLDVGCGTNPYRELLVGASDYVGLDVIDRPGVDIVVDPSQRWPVPDRSFDCVLSTQVIEHVELFDHFRQEVSRVCRPGGLIVFSMPFLYQEHGSPYDYRRFTTFGAVRLLPFNVVHLERLGGIGSTVGQLVMNWIDDTLNSSKLSRFAKAPLLPVWMLFCLISNLICFAWDRLDRTDCYYSNLLIVFRKTEVDTRP